jgi:hypothetical protein
LAVEPICPSPALKIKVPPSFSNILSPCLSSQPQGSLFELINIISSTLFFIFSKLYSLCKIFDFKVSTKPATNIACLILILIFSKILKIKGQPALCPIKIVSLSKLKFSTINGTHVSTPGLSVSGKPGSETL